MKQNKCFLVLLIFLFVFLSPASSSRFLSTSEVLKEEIKIGKVSLSYSLDQMETTDSVNKLMGQEECEDEECLKRRVLAEAHLDYIYTQHHNHP